MTGGQYLPGHVRGADALADSPLMGPLMVQLREVLDAKVLPLLPPPLARCSGGSGRRAGTLCCGPLSSLARVGLSE
jgi:hypothetical protein